MAFESHHCSLCYFFFMVLRSCFFFAVGCRSFSWPSRVASNSLGTKGLADARRVFLGQALHSQTEGTRDVMVYCLFVIWMTIMMVLLMMLIILVFVLVTAVWKLDLCVCTHSHMEQTIYRLHWFHSRILPVPSLGLVVILFVCLFSAFCFVCSVLPDQWFK